MNQTCIFASTDLVFVCVFVFILPWQLSESQKYLSLKHCGWVWIQSHLVSIATIYIADFFDFCTMRHRTPLPNSVLTHVCKTRRQKQQKQGRCDVWSRHLAGWLEGNCSLHSAVALDGSKHKKTGDTSSLAFFNRCTDFERFIKLQSGLDHRLLTLLSLESYWLQTKPWH